MNILHINTFDVGGAAKACIRLHGGLLEAGAGSNLLLKQKSLNEPRTFQFLNSARNRFAAKVRRLLFELRIVKDPVRSKKQLTEAFFLQTLPSGSDYFSFPTTGIDVMQSPLYQAADIIHLHWVADFIDYPTFFKNNKKPLVWTLHDMGPFQGGLHYEEKFTGVDENGGPRPRKFSVNETTVMANNLRVKIESFQNVANLHVVSPSEWLMNRSVGSELFSRFPHKRIPYGVDETVFTLRNKSFARDVLGLPLEKKIVVFVADSIQNTRKGFGFLEGALSMLQHENVLLCAVGATCAPLRERIHYLGRVTDERLMSIVYSAADVFTISSLEDNLPNTVLESLLCGTPVVGFPVGGIREMVRNDINGFLASEITVNSLAHAIDRVIGNLSHFDNQKISEEAKLKFNLKRQASDYLKLYSEILNGVE